MEKTFPQCKELYKDYNECFAKQKWVWGRANGEVEDECEDLFNSLRECVLTATEEKKLKKQAEASR